MDIMGKPVEGTIDLVVSDNERGLEEGTGNMSVLNENDDDDDGSTTSSLMSSVGDRFSSSGDESETEEAMEAQAGQALEAGVTMMAQQRFREAHIVFDNCLETDLFDRIDTDYSCRDWTFDPHGARRKLTVIELAFYGIQKNLATILSMEQQYRQASDCLFKALCVDDTETTVWMRLGDENLKLKDYTLAKFAFLQAHRRDSSNRSALDQLLKLEFILADFEDCLLDIKSMLDIDPNYTVGMVLRDEILRLSPYLKRITADWWTDSRDPVLIKAACKYSDAEKDQILSRYRLLMEENQTKCRQLSQMNDIAAIVPPDTVQPPDGSSWAQLGDGLCNLYDRSQSTSSLSLVASVDLRPWMQNVRTKWVERRTLKAASSQSAARTTTVESAILGKPNRDESAEDISVVCNKLLQNIVGLVSSDKHTEPLKKRLADNLDRPKSTTPKRKRRYLAANSSQTESDSGAGNEDDSYFKRRSTRLVPGFTLEDGYLNASAQAKNRPLSETLLDYVPRCLEKLSTACSSNSSSCTSLMNTPTRCDDNVASSLAPTTLKQQQDVKHLLSTLPSLEADEMTLEREMDELLKAAHGQHISAILGSFLSHLVTKFESTKWSSALKSVFVRCYECWRLQNPFVTPWDCDKHDRIVTHANLQLAYSELMSATNARNGDFRKHQRAIHELKLLTGFDGLLSPVFICRVLYLLAEETTDCHLKRQYLNGTKAILATISSQTSGVERILLPNSAVVLCESLIDQKVKHLDQFALLSSVSQLFEDGRFGECVSVLSQELLSPRRRASTSVERRTQHIGMFIDCLLHLDGRDVDALHWLTVLIGIRLDELFAADDEMKTKIVAELNGSVVKLNKLFVPAGHSQPFRFHRIDLANLSKSLAKIIELKHCEQQKGHSDIDSVPCWIALYHCTKLLERPLMSKGYLKGCYKVATNQRIMLATNSLMILHKAHEILGAKHLCCEKGGELLLLFVEEIRCALQTATINDLISAKDAKFKGVKDDMLNAAEQCFFCLYRYPPKRKRHLEEHHSGQQCIPLTWQRAVPVFEFVQPDVGDTPEFDGFATDALNADAVHVLTRIETLVPPELDPASLVTQFENYLSTAACGGVNWPRLNLSVSDRIIVGELYHLLADYYLKSRELDKAIAYYSRDLCLGVHESRCFDSWGGMALARATIVENAITYMDGTWADSEAAIRLDAERAFRCFETAFLFNSSHQVLKMECAALAYQMQAFIGRGLGKTKETPIDNRSRLLALRGQLLDRAERLYGDVLVLLVRDDAGGSTDAWLCHYFIGKIKEKRSAPLQQVFCCYLKAHQELLKNGAKCPEKIRYNSPPRFALEALEVYYRMYTVCLKRILRGQTPLKDLILMWRCLQAFEHQGDKPITAAGISSDRNLSRLRISSDPDATLLLDEICDEVSDSIHDVPDVVRLISEIVDSVALIEAIVKVCVEAMQKIIRRFQNHYKAYYRLAQAYFCIPSIEDTDVAEKVMFSSLKPRVQTGLFQQRKHTHFFEGVFRIPIDDIDRYGSFSQHMVRTVRMAMQVLTRNRSERPLFDIALSLTKMPDTDKRYLLEEDRRQLCEEASHMAGTMMLRNSQAATSADISKALCMLLARHFPWLRKHATEGWLKKWGRILQAVYAKWKSLATVSRADVEPNSQAASVKPKRDPLDLVLQCCAQWLRESDEKQRSKTLDLKHAAAVERNRKRQAFGQMASDGNPKRRRPIGPGNPAMADICASAAVLPGSSNNRPSSKPMLSSDTAQHPPLILLDDSPSQAKSYRKATVASTTKRNSYPTKPQKMKRHPSGTQPVARAVHPEAIKQMKQGSVQYQRSVGRKVQSGVDQRRLILYARAKEYAQTIRKVLIDRPEMKLDLSKCLSYLELPQAERARVSADARMRVPIEWQNMTDDRQREIVVYALQIIQSQQKFPTGATTTANSSRPQASKPVELTDEQKQFIRKQQLKRKAPNAGPPLVVQQKAQRLLPAVQPQSSSSAMATGTAKVTSLAYKSKTEDKNRAAAIEQLLKLKKVGNVGQPSTVHQPNLLRSSSPGGTPKLLRFDGPVTPAMRAEMAAKSTKAAPSSIKGSIASTSSAVREIRPIADASKSITALVTGQSTAGSESFRCFQGSALSSMLNAQKKSKAVPSRPRHPAGDAASGHKNGKGPTGDDTTICLD